MTVTPSMFNPPPVFVDVILTRTKFFFFKKKFSERITLEPFTLKAEVWANDKFSDNDSRDNGLTKLAERLEDITDNAIFQLAFYLLKEKDRFNSVEKLEYFWKELKLSRLYLFQAIEKVVRNSQPFLEAERESKEIKKKALK